MFSEEKVAQMAAYLLLKRGGRMAYLKLMKLLYLANRQSMIRHGRMMGEDRLYSMRHGPVMSTTLDLIRGKSDIKGEYWYHLIKTNSHDVALCADPREMDVDEVFDELSRADIRILDEIYAQYGHMNRFELRDMTHLRNVCPEWHDPGNSRTPIDVREIFLNEGKSPEEAENIIRSMCESQQLKEFSSQLS
ncbi:MULTISPECIES: Panacea domain-containing protein [Raoultella]|uniref:Panacea domain-containing protein n=1 Tax=Raoultella TaxID=160674 RepID=UPI002168E402|nr:MULTISPECIES: Panacea domain-containing protein [Raoultella]MCS4273511.1 putative phage-associated protein [Raoultella sp. BIGb0132]MCS4290140.1 putative phage-associated protein [Raoultella terrigena]